MIDLIGKRFVGFLVTLVSGFLAARFITDGVSLAHFYDFATILFGAYMAGQTVSDSVAFMKGLKGMMGG